MLPQEHINMQIKYVDYRYIVKWENPLYCIKQNGISDHSVISFITWLRNYVKMFSGSLNFH